MLLRIHCQVPELQSMLLHASRSSVSRLVCQYRTSVRDTTSWLDATHAIMPLSLVKVLDPNVHHVLVTTGQLIPTLAKLLISGLDAYVSAGNIYSARNETKDQCFRHIKATLGPIAKYCVIGEQHYSHMHPTRSLASFSL